MSGNDKDVALTGIGASVSVGNVAMNINGPDRAEINDFVGQSKSRRLPSGKLEFTTGEPPLQGRSNEQNVLKVLVETMTAESNQEQSYREGDQADDGRGIDGYVTFPDGTTAPVQVVKTPVDQRWGAAVAKGNAMIIASLDEAAGWIRAAIDHKVTGSSSIAQKDRLTMILALDARHAGMLGADDVISAFHRQMPELATLGFRAVWLVGNTSVNTKRLA